MTSTYYNAERVWTGTAQNWDRAVDYTYTADTLNRQSVTDNGAVTSYAPSALNQYQSNAGTIYNYDSNFNLREAPNWGGVFDGQSQLTVAAHGGGAAYFTYDGLGRCVRRVFYPPGGGSSTVIYVYDGWKPVVEWDESGNCQAWNIYGSGSDEILWRAQSGVGNLRYHHDVHGNVAFVLGEGGQPLERYSYDAFGQPKIMDWAGNERASSAIGNRFLFQGREWIPELGIYDYRHRMYQPQLGRFLQSDPTGFDAGDMNLFRYCGDDPEDRSDPMGLVAEKAFGPLTSFDGGDWVRGSDGLTASDWDHKHDQAGMDGGGGGVGVTGRTSEGGSGEGGGQSESSNASMKFVPVKLFNDKKTAVPSEGGDKSGDIYEYQLRDSSDHRVGGAGYTVQEKLEPKRDVPNNHAVAKKDEKPRALQSNGIYRDYVGHWFRPSSEFNGYTSVSYQTFDLRYNGRPVEVSTRLVHDVRVVNGEVVRKVYILTRHERAPTDYEHHQNIAAW